MNNRKTIALIIWWCEGTKARRDKRWKNAYLYPVEVTNTDPILIKIFLDYLLYDLNVSLSKFKGQIQIHQGDNKEKIEKYWSSILKIPLSQFNKTIIRPKGNKPGKNNGTFKLRLYDKKIYMKLLSLLNKELSYIESGV